MVGGAGQRKGGGAVRPESEGPQGPAPSEGRPCTGDRPSLRKEALAAAWSAALGCRAVAQESPAAMPQPWARATAPRDTEGLLMDQPLTVGTGPGTLETAGL